MDNTNHLQYQGDDSALSTDEEEQHNINLRDPQQSLFSTKIPGGELYYIQSSGLYTTTGPMGRRITKAFLNKYTFFLFRTACWKEEKT